MFLHTLFRRAAWALALLAEQGLPGFQVVVWHGIYAPKGTPKLAELGAVVPPDDKLGLEGLKTWLQQETQRYAPVIKAAGQFAD